MSLLTARHVISLGAIGLAIVSASVSGCGTGTNADGPEKGYAARIAKLRVEPVLHLSYRGAEQSDSGASTTCEDPEFSPRTPAVFREYRYSGDRADAVMWLNDSIESAGWAALGDPQPTAGGKVTIVNFVKGFGDWKSKLFLSVQDHSYEVVLQADERSDCPDV